MEPSATDLELRQGHVDTATALLAEAPHGAELAQVRRVEKR